ncbi:MAG: hypothetical protein HY347_06830 [candidate division NC10 bacterium]|nr:hypothetical protein [candidate division NC10 bacterium]
MRAKNIITKSWRATFSGLLLKQRCPREAAGPWRSGKEKRSLVRWLLATLLWLWSAPALGQTLLLTLDHPTHQAGAGFGFPVVGIGDVNSDGVPDLDAGAANESGLLFRYADGTWVYNLNTRDLSAGTYTITLQMPDGRRYNAGFVLQ